MDKTDSDSDCEILEREVSTIIIPDSPMQVGKTEPREEPRRLNLEDDEEEGEIDDGEDEVKVEASKAANVEKPIIESVPVFEIKFHDKKNFLKLGHNIIEALRETLFYQKQGAEEHYFKISVGEGENEEVNIKVFVVDGSPVTVVEDEVEAPVSQPQIPKSPPPTVAVKPEDVRPNSKEQSPDVSDLSSLFVVDTAPAAKLDTVQVPSYKRASQVILNEELTERKRKKENEADDADKCERPKRPSAACFNCGSVDHGIRNCPHPRNIKRINLAKKNFGTKQERYHADIEQRFAHLRPGVLTTDLQNALNLHHGELPFFYYRMRVLGYPPGWLKDAKVADSGITLFSSDGTEVLQSDKKENEGVGKNHKYDVNRIVGFPGYNVDPGTNFYDDYRYHNVPPMRQQDMKDEFIKTLGANIVNGYRRKKLKDLPTAKLDETVAIPDTIALTATDMEIEDSDLTTDNNVIFTRPLPPPDDAVVESPSPVPPPLEEAAPPPPSVETSSAMEERSQSPTLADLEEQQLKLLQELQSNVSNITAATETDDSLIDEVLVLDETQTDLDESNKTATAPSTCDKAEQRSIPSTPTANTIKESHFGTPVLKFSKFDKLPAGENFKVGVSDVINFENLPDSTGKYEEMKVVIKKVRRVVTNLLNEDD